MKLRKQAAPFSWPVTLRSNDLGQYLIPLSFPAPLLAKPVLFKISRPRHCAQ
jgi:hypothetical protein